MVETIALWGLFLACVWAKGFIAYITLSTLNRIRKDEGIGTMLISSVFVIPVGFVLNLFASFVMFMPVEEMWSIEYTEQLPMWLNVIIFWLPPGTFLF